MSQAVSKREAYSPRTYHIITYGCQMNDNDSEIMSGLLEAKGMERVATEQEADVVLVNTCVVREGAEDRAVSRLSHMAALKRKRPEVIIGVAGCMAQKDGEKLLEKVPHADLVVGTRDLFKLGSLIDEILRTGDRIVATEDVDKPVFLDAHPVRRQNGLKALVTVMYGCNNFCSFCIVPTTRGREVSRAPSDIVDEVGQLARQGYKEVMLLGQNVNSYRDNGSDFADLLEQVNTVQGIDRVRFITSHPKDCSDKLIAAVGSLPKLCTNFHLPAQAGSDPILRRMKRFYTKEHYLDLIGRVRAGVAGATISTDIIVGFPGETEEDFEQTCDLLERARWDSAFIFMYSPRQGTKAFKLPDSVPPDTKKKRLQRLLARQEEISGEINRSMIGSQQEVLVESASKRSSEDMVGRTKGDKSVIFRGAEELIGRLVNVRITDAVPHTLFGEQV